MKKINKATARKLWEQGKEFWMCACNMRPECGNLIQPQYHKDFASFNVLYNNFCYYNCNSETGRYPAFYIDD